MVKQIRLKRGIGRPTSLNVGEPAVDIENKILYIGTDEDGGPNFLKIIDEGKIEEVISQSINVLIKKGIGNYSLIVNDINNNNSEGEFSLAEGNNTGAFGYASHAEGGLTVANGDYSHVQGKFNIVDSENKYADIVGNGTTNDDRSNAFALDWDGNGYYAGDVYVNTEFASNGAPTGKKLVTEEYVSSIEKMIHNLHYYCNKDIMIDTECFMSEESDVLWTAWINCETCSDNILVVPVDLYNDIWNVNRDKMCFPNDVSVANGDKITKIIIPRGMKFRDPVTNNEFVEDDLISMFPNLTTIVNIHEDGAVLSYNIIEQSMNS